MALMIQLCLKINRVDVAQRHFKKMQGIDEESTLTQLCSAWINLSLVRSRSRLLSYVCIFVDSIGMHPANTTAMGTVALLWTAVL